MLSSQARHPADRPTLAGRGPRLNLVLSVFTGAGYLFDRTGQGQERSSQHSHSINTFVINK